MSADHLKQVKQLNQRPAGQVCRDLLSQEKVWPDPYALYPLQLAQWVLRNLEGDRLLGPWAPNQQALENQVEMMFEFDPKLVIWALAPVSEEKESSDQAVESLARQIQPYRDDAGQVAMFLLENLYDKLGWS